MDDENMSNLMAIRPKGSKAVVKLLGEYDPEGERIIVDPYYGGRDGFERNFQQCMRSCAALVDELKSL